MLKRTLKFPNLYFLAKFSKSVTTGYLMNTNNLTITGKFTESELNLAIKQFQAIEIETTDKVFSYGPA